MLYELPNAHRVDDRHTHWFINSIRGVYVQIRVIVNLARTRALNLNFKLKEGFIMNYNYVSMALSRTLIKVLEKCMINVLYNYPKSNFSFWWSTRPNIWKVYTFESTWVVTFELHYLLILNFIFYQFEFWGRGGGRGALITIWTQIIIWNWRLRYLYVHCTRHIQKY